MIGPCTFPTRILQNLAKKIKHVLNPPLPRLFHRYHHMPRPCQKRRTSAAANRNPKPAGPPPIRHKARQKAIHNARRGRGGARGNMNGGRPSRHQQSGHDMEQDFISFSSGGTAGNNFQALNGAGNEYQPFGDVPGSGMEEGELMTDDGTDSDEMEELDTDEAGDMMINVDVNGPGMAKGAPGKPVVMFSVDAALAIYRELWRARFPLSESRIERYGVPDGYSSSDSMSHLAVVDTVGSATRNVPNGDRVANHAGRDYVFDWGKYSGTPFLEVPETYLRTIGGQLDIYEGKHRGLREAYDYHRPGQARAAAPHKPGNQSQPKPFPRTAPPPRVAPASQTGQPSRAGQPSRTGQPSQTAPPPRAPRAPRAAAPPRQGNQASSRVVSNGFVFKKGAHKGKSLHEVPENYIRTLEGMSDVVEKWPGFKAALHEFNEKTGRKSRGGKGRG